MFTPAAQSAQHVETFASADPGLLRTCQQRMTGDCLADVAWSIARAEKRSFNLGQLAPVFAQLNQWGRAEELLARIPDGEQSARSLPLKYVAAERLAAALSSGTLAALKPVKDPLTLSVTTSRLLGYLKRESIVPSDRIGRRINEGLWLTTLKADRSANLALVDHWSRLADAGPSYLRIRLADAFFLLGEPARARTVAQTIVPKPKDVGRDHVEMWLRLGEPDRALDAIKVFEPRHRGLYKVLVAKSLATSGDAKRASVVAMEAANDALTASDDERLGMAAELLVEMNRPDLAKQIAVEAEQRSGRDGTLRPFYLSAVGEMHGRAGDPKACLRLQANAVGAEGKGVVAWGLISGPVGYGAGRFDLRPGLRQNVAVRSFRCGDAAALKEIENRSLARNYCDYYQRGLVKPDDIDKRPHKRTDDDAPRSFLLDQAAECHFERGETAVALPLLNRLVEDVQSSKDFNAAYSAADLACVYGSQKICLETLQVAGSVLIRNVEARKLSAQRVAEFAVAWRYRVSGGRDQVKPPGER
jgi:hypothetical protein